MFFPCRTRFFSARGSKSGFVCPTGGNKIHFITRYFASEKFDARVNQGHQTSLSQNNIFFLVYSNNSNCFHVTRFFKEELISILLHLNEQ